MSSSLTHKVPIHLEQPDVLLFGLTSRQVLLLGVGLAVSYAAWSSLLDLPGWWGVLAAYLGGLLVLLLFVLTAFVKIKGRGLEVWAVVLLMYAGEPKVYLLRSASEYVHAESLELPEDDTKQAEKEEEEW